MSHLQLANALRESVKHFKQLAELSDQLDELGRIEQTAEELNKAVNQRRRQLEALLKEYESVKRNVAEARQQTIADAEAEAKRITDQAKSEHAIVMEDARSKAAATKKAAQAHAEDIIKEANNLKAQAEALLDGKEAEMQALQSQYDGTKAELDTAEAKLKDIKQQLANFMNGGN